MLNPFKEVRWNPGRSELNSFAKSLLVGFPCVALVLLVSGYVAGKGWNLELALKVGGLGAAAGLVFLLVPVVAKPFYVVWYFLACCIGLVVGNILLMLVFYVFLTGLGLVMKMRRRRPIRRTIDRQATTYWQTAEQPSDPRRYYNQF